MHSWLYNICMRMQWPYLTLHYFPLYTCLNTGKTAWKKQPSPFLAARPLMNACLPCGIFLWLLKDKRGTEWAVPKGHQKTQLKLLNTLNVKLLLNIESFVTQYWRVLKAVPLFTLSSFYPLCKHKWDWGKANSPNYILLCQLMLTVISWN